MSIRMPSRRITDELVHLMFCPPQPRDHHAQTVTARDIVAVIILLATMALLGAAVCAEWVVWQ
ncbi:hypothetical protein A5622_11610 [Mycobacterium sp. 1245801.1]|nr:hypothetical protein A5622_11610 [Mycobacterium sp. 1245801.1]